MPRRFSEADERLLEVAKSLPADVLVEAVKIQAARSIFSEAYCRELAEAYSDAADTARIRRTYPDSTVTYRTSNLSICSQE